MVIISNQQLIGKTTDSGNNNNFAKYALWRTTKGIQTATYAIEDISRDYTGASLQEKILNFIRDAKKTWGIQYVILGGDSNIIPSKTIYSIVSETKPPTKAFFPSDTYYACLDNNPWEDHNNGKKLNDYHRKMDLLAEVYVGRVSVVNQQQVQNFFMKQRIKELKPENSKAFLFGGMLFRDKKNPCDTSKYTWGECFIENLISSNSSIQKMQIAKRYQMNNTLDPHSLIQEINQFQPDIVIPEFHGEASGLAGYPSNCIGDPFMMQGSLTIDQIDGFNNKMPFLFHTGIPCMTNAFDEINDLSWNQDDREYFNSSETIAEKMIRIPHGAYAYIGNSHYGWFDPFSYGNSASHLFQIAFFQRFFIPGMPLGKAFHEAKEQFIPLMSKRSDYRWVYHSLNLLGDPSMGEKSNPGNSFSSAQSSPPMDELEEGKIETLEYEISNDLDELTNVNSETPRKTHFILEKGSNVIAITPDDFSLEPGKKQIVKVTIQMPDQCKPNERVPFAFTILTDLGENEKIEFSLRCKKKEDPLPPPEEDCCSFKVVPDWNNLPVVPEGEQGERVILTFNITNLCPKEKKDITFYLNPACDAIITPSSFQLAPQSSQIVTMDFVVFEKATPGEITGYPFAYKTNCNPEYTYVTIPIKCKEKASPPPSCCSYTLTPSSKPPGQLKPGEAFTVEYELSNTCPTGSKDITFAFQGSSNLTSITPSKLTLSPGKRATIKVAGTMPKDCKGGAAVTFTFVLSPDCGKEEKFTFTIQCTSPPPSCCDWIFRTRPELRLKKLELCPGETMSIEHYEVFNNCPKGSNALTFSISFPNDGKIVSVSPSSFTLQAQERKTLQITIKMPECKVNDTVSFPMKISTRECGEKEVEFKAYCKDCWCKHLSKIIKVTKLDLRGGWLEGTPADSKTPIRFYFDATQKQWSNIKLDQCIEICYEERKDRAGNTINWALDYRVVECTYNSLNILWRNYEKKSISLRTCSCFVHVFC